MTTFESRLGGRPVPPDAGSPAADARPASGTPGGTPGGASASLFAPDNTRPLAQLAFFALFTAVYLTVGKLGLLLAIVHPSATAVWPPAGLALAALLHRGPRAWPGVFVGAFLVNATTAGSIVTSLGIATGNTLEALVGAFLVSRFANGRLAFRTSPDTMKFALAAGLVSPAVSATLGVGSVAATGFAAWSDFGRIWLTWWLGDMGGNLVVAPLVLLWSAGGRMEWTRARVLEAGLLLASLLVVGRLVFGPLAPFAASGDPLKFLCLPLLVWAAFRFDQRIVATATAVVTAIAVWSTLTTGGPATDEERNVALLLLQVFMGVTAATILVMAATVAVRRRMEERLRTVSERLREAMGDLEAYSRSMSHDLRSPIGAVLNNSEILEHAYRGRLDGEAVRLLRGIRLSAASAVRLLDQLVEFAWVEREEAETQDIDLTRIAREAFVEVMSAREAHDAVHLELRPLPPAQGNGRLMGRVFSNLFGNAEKHTRGRAIRRIEVSGEAGEREHVYRVADNGFGFDPVLGNDMFRPFRRLSRDRRIEGTGLGLAIAAKIVHRHGGRIWAESDGASGARFCFTLPNRKRAR